jgi:hypothetical protein
MLEQRGRRRSQHGGFLMSALYPKADIQNQPRRDGRATSGGI